MKACVTGSSTGIGRAIAIALANDGFEVLLHGRSDSKELEETLSEVVELSPQSTKVTGDFSQLDFSFENFVETAFGELGQVDVWVNNAGADVLTGDLSEESFSKKLEQLWKVDVRSTALLSRLAGQTMIKRNPESSQPVGSIINVGWDQAITGIAEESGIFFSATKGAIMAMTGSLAKNLAPKVRVNCVAPGWIKTEWGESTSQGWNDRAISESLLRRWGTPEDIANLVAFLASQQAEFINGQVISVNGGFNTNPSVDA